jgi:hypothetical protein
VKPSALSLLALSIVLARSLTASAQPARCTHEPAPSAHTLLAALSPADYGAHARPLSDLRVAMVQLDDSPSSEAVLAASRDSEGYGPEDLLWVFSRSASGWTLRGTSSSIVNRESGNVDASGRRGTVVLRGVPAGHGCRELLRVERLRTNFQPVPQSSRSFELFTLSESGLRRAFGCHVVDGARRFTVRFDARSAGLSLVVRALATGTSERYWLRAGRFVTDGADRCFSRAWGER